MKLCLVAFVVLVLIALPAFAICPLVVEQEIQLPYNAPWDVQHVTGDSTFGWACLANDSIYWVENLGDPVNVIEIPDAAFEPFYTAFPGANTPHHQQIMMLRYPNQGDDMCVLVQSRIYWDEWHAYSYFWFLNLETDSLLGWFWSPSIHIYYDGGIDFSESCYVKRPVLAPFLPEATSVTMVGMAYTWSRYEMGGFWSNGSYQTTHFTDLRGESLSDSIIERSADVSLFADGRTQIRFALGGLVQTTNSIQRWITSYIVDSTVNPRLTSQITSTVIAQMDIGGTQRIIAKGIYALDPDTYEQLWNVTESDNGFFAVRLYESPDERVLAYQSSTHCFRVYDASNGYLLGETNPIIGDIAYVLKPADRPHEIVTWEGATQTVRIYTTYPQAPDNLTMVYLPNDHMLELRWQPVPNVSSYKIYGAADANSPGELIVYLQQGQTVYHLPATDSLRFFRVTAVYDE